MLTLKIAGIVRDSIVDGVGIRDVLFTQGCLHYCKGCHNSSTWDINGGEEIRVDELVKQLSQSTNSITISGGEPLLQFQQLVQFLYLLNRNDCWLYTGYTFEELSDEIKNSLSPYIEVLVDGKFEINKNDYKPFRGSSNQRLIDLRKSIAKGKIVEYTPFGN